MHRFFKILILLLLFSCIFSACKKKPQQITLTGRIEDASTNEPIKDVYVTLASTSVQSWVYNSNFQDISTIKTLADGSFAISFDQLPASAYRLYITKADYFDNIIFINASGIISGHTYFDVYYLHTEAIINLNIKNVSAYDDDDKITYKIRKGAYDCVNCCPSSYINGFGMQYDTTITCKTYGNTYFEVESAVTKDAQTIFRFDSVFINPSGNNILNIHY